MLQRLLYCSRNLCQPHSYDIIKDIEMAWRPRRKSSSVVNAKRQIIEGTVLALALPWLHTKEVVFSGSKLSSVPIEYVNIKTVVVAFNNKTFVENRSSNKRNITYLLVLMFCKNMRHVDKSLYFIKLVFINLNFIRKYDSTFTINKPVSKHL